MEVVSLLMTTTEELYTDGLKALKFHAGNISSHQWDVITVCGDWSAAELARHLLGVTRWYHEWLDRAIAGDMALPFAQTELDQRNAEVIDSLGRLSGPKALAEMLPLAEKYLVRASDHLERPYAFPFGISTVGTHLAGVAGEWHLHAWDFSTAGNDLHVPENEGDLFRAVAKLIGGTQTGAQGMITRMATPLVSRRNAWNRLLMASGRKAD